jgi:hypothetical protein
MATESWFFIKTVVRHVENDGWAYSRKGPEAEETEMPLTTAIAVYGRDKVVHGLEEVVRDIKNGAYDKKG